MVNSNKKPRKSVKLFSCRVARNTGGGRTRARALRCGSPWQLQCQLPLTLSFNGLGVLISGLILIADRKTLKNTLKLEMNCKNTEDKLMNMTTQFENITQGRLSLNNFGFPISINNEPFNTTTPVSSEHTVYAENPTL